MCPPGLFSNLAAIRKHGQMTVNPLDLLTNSYAAYSNALAQVGFYSGIWTEVLLNKFYI